jgi:hypothetical protein
MNNLTEKERTCHEASHFKQSSLFEKQIELGKEILGFIKTKNLKVKEAYDMLVELANSVLYTKIN